jgi:hypothetical protein
MIALPRARKRHRRSVHNWVNGNKPVVRSESASLIAAPSAKDYIALHAEDSDRAGFELFFDRVVQSYPRLASYVGTP